MKQYQKEVNELRAERLARNANPLALVATAKANQDPYYQTSKSHKSCAPSSKPSIKTRSHTTTRQKGKEIAKPITPPSETASEEDIDPEQAQRDKDMQKNLALIAKYFKKIYKPTNDNLRTSSNSRNKNMDTTPQYKNDNQSGQFGNQRTVNVARARENVGNSVVQQFGIQCFNCKEFGHLGMECRKPKRVKDSVYHKEKMLLCKQAKQGVPLQAEQYDWLADTDGEIDEQELEAHYNYMAKIQEVPTADSGTDSEPLEQNDQNNVESDDERVALANLIANLKLDVDENKKIQKSHISSAPSPKPSIPSRSHTSTRHKGKEIAKPLTPPSETASEEDSDPKQAQRDKDMQKNLALVAKYFKKNSTNLPTTTSEHPQTPRTRTWIRLHDSRMTVSLDSLGLRGLVKDSVYHKEKMLLCKQAEQGVPLQAEQYDWLADTDEEVDEQELEAHYSYMAKIQEVPNADSGTDSKPVEQQLKKVNTTLAQELKECKVILAKTSQSPGESISVRDSFLIELQTKQTEFEKYKAFNDRTIDYDKLEHKLNEALGQIAHKDIVIREGLKTKAYELSVVKEKHDELMKQSLLTKSHYEGLVKQKTKEYETQLAHANEIKRKMWRKSFVKSKPNICKNVEFLPISKSISKSRQAYNVMTNNNNHFKQICDDAWTKHSKDLFRTPTALDMEILIQTCLMPLAIKTQGDSLKFVCELKQEMHADLKYVESFEKEIDELESEKAEFSDMYDVILQDCVSKDVMCSYLQSLSDLDALAELQCMYLHKVKKCDCLAQRLSKQTESVSKKVHTELSQCFAKLEKHSISLEIALQKGKEQAKNDIVCNEKASNGFRKEREQFIKIQDLKAKLQDKNIAISELKKLIENGKGKSVDT
nr:hypothetical protein [Tanacetum cinerariifolium]